MIVDAPASESIYRLRVRGVDGRTQTIELTAPTADRAIAAAESGGGVVERLWMERLGARAATGGRFPLVLFSGKLATLLQSGVNLSEAVQALASSETDSAVRQVLSSLASELQKGRRLSEGLATWPRHFPQVYVAVIRSAEHTGMLREALNRFVAYEEEVQKLRSKLLAASIYPVILLLVGGLVCLFLMGFVVPRFASAYDLGQRDLPLLSRLVLGAGLFVGTHKAAVSIAICALIACGAVLTWTGSVYRGVHALIVRLPWLSELASRYATARFLRAVSMLLYSGIALIRAIEMAADVLPPARRMAVDRSRALLAEGRRFSEALLAAGMSTPIADSLIKVGERAGQLAQALENCARIEEEDFARRIDLVSRLVEPALMIAMGLLIGGVVVLMYMPIFDLAGSLR